MKTLAIGCEIAAMQDEMMRREQAEHRQSTSAEDFKNVSAMMGFILQAQGAWVDALNQQRFSMDADALKQGGSAMRQIGGAGEVPSRNREIVAPYLPKLKTWAPLAFFGL